MQIVIRLLNLDWVGNKNTDNEKFNDMQYVLDQAVEGLGYGMVESNSDIYNLAQFGNEDQTINRFVKKISDKPLTWSQANEEASNNNLNYENRGQIPLPPKSYYFFPPRGCLGWAGSRIITGSPPSIHSGVSTTF